MYVCLVNRTSQKFSMGCCVLRHNDLKNWPKDDENPRSLKICESDCEILRNASFEKRTEQRDRQKHADCLNLRLRICQKAKRRL